MSCEPRSSSRSISVIGLAICAASSSRHALHRQEQLGGHGPPRGGRWGIWSSSDLSGFSAGVDGFEHEAAVLSGYVGADYRFAPNALAGVADSYSTTWSPPW